MGNFAGGLKKFQKLFYWERFFRSKITFPIKSQRQEKPHKQIKTNPTIANISIIKHGHKKQQLVSVIESLLPMRQDGYCPKILELHNVNGNVSDISKCSLSHSK